MKEKISIPVHLTAEDLTEAIFYKAATEMSRDWAIELIAKINNRFNSVRFTGDIVEALVGGLKDSLTPEEKKVWIKKLEKELGL